MSISEYINTFQEHGEVLKTQMGDHTFDYFVEQLLGYKKQSGATAQGPMKDDMFNEVMGVLFLIRADWRRYGSSFSELMSAFAKGRDEYPRSLDSAIDILDKHKVDQAFKDHMRKKTQARTAGPAR